MHFAQWLTLGTIVACASACQPTVPTGGAIDSEAAESGTEQKHDFGDEDVVVFAAASTQESVENVVGEFRRLHPGVEVRASFASSATLAQQIAEGAPADLFLSANPKWVDSLKKKQLVAEDETLLGNELVAVVGKETALAIHQPEDLLAVDVKHIAIGDPDSVPAGIYAKQALTDLGLWQKLHERLVSGKDVRHALAMVETGAAEVGIVYATDAAISNEVKIAFPFDSLLTETIEYPLVLLKQGTEKPAARELYRDLQSPAAAEIFRRAGFQMKTAAGGQE
jgi:molybdate transport system substrate-binding protein